MTVSPGSPVSGTRADWSLRSVATLALATLGLGLNLRAWIVLSPHLQERFTVGLGQYLVLMGLPVLVAGLVRLPVGVLTDRYGSRVMFPAVSLAAAGSVVAAALAGSLSVVVVAGAAAGVAGAAFVVGAALVSSTVGYGRRGVALGVFSIGPAGTVLISAVSRGYEPAGRGAALMLGGLLVGFAGLAALVLRDRAAARRPGSPVRRCVEMIRLASSSSLSLLYALALGGVVAVAVSLPVYLIAVLGLGRSRTFVVTGVVVGLAAAARLVGGWWTDRRPTARLLMVCYAVAAGLCLVVALAPRLWLSTTLLVAAVAVCDGLASGALLALIGKGAPTDGVGAVMGITGAAAALGGVLLPLLMAAADRLSGSAATGWLVLAALLLTAALYVRTHGLQIGLGLPVRSEPRPGPTAMTVAVVDQAYTSVGAAAVVARLADLAASDELVVVYGADEPAQPRLSTNVLVTGLRTRLPRHNVVGIGTRLYTGAWQRLAAILGEFVETGTVAVAVAPPADLREVTAKLSSYLHADRILLMSYTPARGADLHEIWNRGSATTRHR